MKRFLVSASMIAMLMGSVATQSLRAEDEAKGAVPARTDANNPDSAVYRASDIMNMPVKNDDGSEVGHIKDLVINGESREVLYAVVAMNDAKEKDSLYVMPWQVFQPYYGQGSALQYTVLTVPQSVWIQAPFYSPNQWRSARYSQWSSRVNDYYASHIHDRGGRGNAVRAAKPAINDDDVKDNSKKNDRNDRSDRKNDSDKKNDSDNKDRSESRDRNDKDRTEKPAPKNDSEKEAPAPKAAPNPNPAPKAAAPNPNPAPRTEAPAAPKAPAVNGPVPNAPKAPAAPQPREPKTAAPK